MENRHVSDAVSLIQRAEESKQGLQDPVYDQLVDQKISSLIRSISNQFDIEIDVKQIVPPFCCSCKKLEGASLIAYDDLEIAIGI